MPRHQEDIVEGERGRQPNGDLVSVQNVRSGFFHRPLFQAPWHFLYFLPLPHGHGSLRPTFGSSRLTCFTTSSPPVRAGRGDPCAGPAVLPPIAPKGEGGGADCGELNVI